MRITVSLKRETLFSLMRRAGYAPEGTSGNEERFARSLGGRGRYPRFHAYASEEAGTARISLHLDQKQPSYRGTHAHAGEYDGPLVEQEAARIAALAQS